MLSFLVNVWNATHRASFRTVELAFDWAHELAAERQAQVTIYEVVDGKPVHRGTVSPKPRKKAPAPPPPPPVAEKPKAPQIVMPTVKKPAVTGPLKAQGEVDIFDMLD